MHEQSTQISKLQKMVLRFRGVETKSSISRESCLLFDSQRYPHNLCLLQNSEISFHLSSRKLITLITYIRSCETDRIFFKRITWAHILTHFVQTLKNWRKKRANSIGTWDIILIVYRCIPVTESQLYSLIIFVCSGINYILICPPENWL